MMAAFDLIEEYEEQKETDEEDGEKENDGKINRTLIG